MLGAHSQEPGEVFWTRHHLYPCLKGWDSLGRGPWIPPPKASRNPRETLYLSPHIFLFSLGPPPASFLRAGRSCEQPRPPPPSSQPCVTQSKGHLGQPRPVTQWHATQPGKSLFSLSAQASCRPQTGRPALRGGSSGRQGGPCERKGRAQGGRTEGNGEVTSGAPATEAPWQGDGEREGLAGPFCHANHSQPVGQSQRQFQPWLCTLVGIRRSHPSKQDRKSTYFWFRNRQQ